MKGWTMNPDDEPLQAGDVIQLGPDHQWGVCLAVVDEIEPWGVKANIVVPIPKTAAGESIGLIPIRVDTKDFKRVGPARFMLEWWKA